MERKLKKKLSLIVYNKRKEYVKKEGCSGHQKEIDKHLKIALKEIGKIKPWYDEQVNAWIFEHPLYPVGYREMILKK